MSLFLLSEFFVMLFEFLNHPVCPCDDCSSSSTIDVGARQQSQTNLEVTFLPIDFLSGCLFLIGSGFLIFGSFVITLTDIFIIVFKKSRKTTLGLLGFQTDHFSQVCHIFYISGRGLEAIPVPIEEFVNTSGGIKYDIFTNLNNHEPFGTKADKIKRMRFYQIVYEIVREATIVLFVEILKVKDSEALFGDKVIDGSRPATHLRNRAIL